MKLQLTKASSVAVIFFKVFKSTLYIFLKLN